MLAECITNQYEKSELTWEVLKKYSIILWYENIHQITKWMETIASNVFTSTRDAS